MYAYEALRKTDTARLDAVKNSRTSTQEDFIQFSKELEKYQEQNPLQVRYCTSLSYCPTKEMAQELAMRGYDVIGCLVFEGTQFQYELAVDWSCAEEERTGSVDIILIDGTHFKQH